MTTTTKRVRLYFYLKENETTTIDRFEARRWEDFLIVRVKGLTNDYEAQQLYERIERLRESLGVERSVVIIPDNLDLEFYGVEIETDE